MIEGIQKGGSSDMPICPKISNYVQNVMVAQKRNRETVGAVAEDGIKTGQS